MKNWKIVAIVACAFALCLALVGCGGGSAGGTDEKAQYIGTWDLVSMEESDGTVTSQEDIEMLASLGMEVYVELNEDGTCALVLFGESMEGTWEPGAITMEGQTVNMSITDGQLVLEQEGEKLVFTPGEARS